MRPVRFVAVIVAAMAAVSLAVPDVHPARFKKLSRKDVHKHTEFFSPLLARDIAAMQYVLEPGELADLLSPPEEKRCQLWIDAWWHARDPIHTSPQNEARFEHERRVLVAEMHFARGAWPGWDDRGEVFIRYGAPGSRSLVKADVVEPGEYVPAQEFWYYPAFDMIARFADPTGSGRFSLFLDGVHLPARERARSDRRQMPSEYLADLSLDYMGFEYDIPGAMNLRAPFAGKQGDDFMKRVYRYHDVLEETPAAYPFDFASRRIPMFFAVHSFRGGDGVDRVDVNAEFETRVVPLAGNSYARRFVTTSVFWDLAGNEIARHARTDTVGTGSLAGDSVAAVVNQTSVTLPPGTYRMAITVQESGSGRFTSTRRVVGCHSMEGGLAMSDLLLARRIGGARGESPFNRGPLEVVPRPSGHYRLGAPVPVYFEVYHLGQDAGGSYAYTVEYAITPKSARPRNFWKRLISAAEPPLVVRSRFDAAAPGPDDVVHVAASTQNLWPGEFALQVTVTDGASSRRVSRETTFRLLPPAR